MQKKIITMVLVVTIGVLAGVAIVNKQAREPLLREILQSQQNLIQAQHRIERKMSSGEGILEEDNPFAVNRIKILENRIAVLEAQVKGWDALMRAGGARQAAPQDDLTTVHDIPVAHSPVRGSKDAPVTIVEFVDFQCSFCARFHPPILAVLEAYPEKVNYILKNFPLPRHPQAQPAARAAFAAGEQGKYWEMVDSLLENGRSLNDEMFEKLAGDIGLDMEEFKEDYVDIDGKWSKYIEEDMSLAQKVGVRGTPTFYINGRKTGARDFNGLKKEIDGILSEQK